MKCTLFTRVGSTVWTHRRRILPRAKNPAVYFCCSFFSFFEDAFIHFWSPNARRLMRSVHIIQGRQAFSRQSNVTSCLAVCSVNRAGDGGATASQPCGKKERATAPQLRDRPPSRFSSASKIHAPLVVTPLLFALNPARCDTRFLEV